jgi:hypothetical protein
MESVASPASDAALAWTTNQVTQEGRDAWVRAAESAVTRMSAPPGAPFRPLERAEDVVRLLRGQRAPVNEKESALLESLSTPHRGVMGVSIVAATDDESPHAAVLYRVDDPFFVTAMNVVTREERGETPPDPARYPRLATWAKGADGSFGGGCFGTTYRWCFFGLFHRGGASLAFSCEVRPVAEISPGLGRIRPDHDGRPAELRCGRAAVLSMPTVCAARVWTIARGAFAICCPSNLAPWTPACTTRRAPTAAAVGACRRFNPSWPSAAPVRREPLCVGSAERYQARDRCM